MLKAPKIVVAPAAVLRKKAEPVSVREIGGRALLELVAGCLSVPKIYGRVRRATRAVVKATDEHGREFSVIGRGLLAQIFQHETDHLEGKLFVDSAKETWEFDPEHPNAGKK